MTLGGKIIIILLVINLLIKPGQANSVIRSIAGIIVSLIISLFQDLILNSLESGARALGQGAVAIGLG